MESHSAAKEINDKGEFLSEMNNNDKGIDENINLNVDIDMTNHKEKDQISGDTMQTYSFLDIEEFLKSGKVPPGIKEYDDLPAIEPSQPSESKVVKAKKPWETDDNLKNLNFIEN